MHERVNVNCVKGNKRPRYMSQGYAISLGTHEVSTYINVYSV